MSKISAWGSRDLFPRMWESKHETFSSLLPEKWSSHSYPCMYMLAHHFWWLSHKSGFKPTNNSSKLPLPLSFSSPKKRDGAPHSKPFHALCHHSSAPLLPPIHLKASGTPGYQQLPITLQQRSSIPPACASPSHHSPLEKFPSLLVSQEKPY